jgi:hypothetical protein
MLGFGSLGQFSLGEAAQPDVSIILTQVSGTGQAGVFVPTVTSFTFAGVAGIGVAGSITPNPKAVPSMAAGIGVAGTLNSFNVTITLAAASGTGVARGATPAVAVALVGVAATGVARSFGSLALSIAIPAATGTGVARAVTPKAAVALAGVAGTGQAGSLGIFNVALTVPAATGTGTAGSLRSSLTTGLVGVSGIGTTNWVARAFLPYAFVDLVHFDAYPVLFDVPDIVKVSVVLASAVGGGVAGQIRPLISGGGGGERKKHKTGLEPVRKLPPRVVEVVEQRLPLPPAHFVRTSPSLAPADDAPPALVDQALVPADLLGLQEQIRAAEDATDISDILDVLAFLDSSST